MSYSFIVMLHMVMSFFLIAISIYCNHTVLKILNLLGFFTLTSVLSSSLNLVLTAVIVAF